MSSVCNICFRVNYALCSKGWPSCAWCLQCRPSTMDLQQSTLRGDPMRSCCSGQTGKRSGTSSTTTPATPEASTAAAGSSSSTTTDYARTTSASLSWWKVPRGRPWLSMSSGRLMEGLCWWPKFMCPNLLCIMWCTSVVQLLCTMMQALCYMYHVCTRMCQTEKTEL